MEIAITTFFTHLQRDVDNVVKPILDGLKGVLYVDDAEIVRLISQRETAIEKCGFYLPDTARYEHLLKLPESEASVKAVQTGNLSNGSDT